MSLSQYPATEALKVAGPIGAYVGSYLGAGLPGMAGYYLGSDPKTPDANMGFWRPALSGLGGTFGGAAIGGLGTAGLGALAGMDSYDVGAMVPVGAAIGGLGGGTVGTFMAAEHQSELPRPRRKV